MDEDAGDETPWGALLVLGLIASAVAYLVWGLWYELWLGRVFGYPQKEANMLSAYFAFYTTVGMIAVVTVALCWTSIMHKRLEIAAKRQERLDAQAQLDREIVLGARDE